MSEAGVPEVVPQRVLELGGKKFTLVHTFGTALRLRRALKQLGVDADDAKAVAAADQAEVSLLTLWAMVAHGEHKDMEPDELADLIPLDEMAALLDQVDEVKAESEPEPEKGKAKPKAKKKAKANA